MDADLGSPFFWHLDGCEMDDQFEFSFFKTRADWDADRHRLETFYQQMVEERKEGEAGIVNDFETTLMADEAEPC